jgi:hypothetical protein
MSQNISSLDGLRVEAEDVIHGEDGNLRGGGSGHVGLEAIELDVFAFGLVVFGDDGWDSKVWLVSMNLEEIDSFRNLLATSLAVL